jgi:hypothetical protein
MESTIATFGRHWNSIQKYLFPYLEDEIGELDSRQKAFVEICEILLTVRHF